MLHCECAATLQNSPHSYIVTIFIGMAIKKNFRFSVRLHGWPDVVLLVMVVIEMVMLMMKEEVMK